MILHYEVTKFEARWPNSESSCTISDEAVRFLYCKVSNPLAGLVVNNKVLVGEFRLIFSQLFGEFFIEKIVYFSVSIGFEFLYAMLDE